MQNRYRLYQRDNRTFYVHDNVTNKQVSLKTKDKREAQRLFAAKNQAVEQPQMNVAMARVYLMSKSPELLSRTWGDVMADKEQNYQDAKLRRWQR